jgi:hypothetical protein
MWLVTAWLYTSGLPRGVARLLDLSVTIVVLLLAGLTYALTGERN